MVILAHAEDTSTNDYDALRLGHHRGRLHGGPVSAGIKRLRTLPAALFLARAFQPWQFQAGRDPLTALRPVIMGWSEAPAAAIRRYVLVNFVHAGPCSRSGAARIELRRCRETN
jgi:hypothetical protein